jgi:hypothetical protein
MRKALLRPTEEVTWNLNQGRTQNRRIEVTGVLALLVIICVSLAASQEIPKANSLSSPARSQELPKTDRGQRTERGWSCNYGSCARQRCRICVSTCQRRDYVGGRSTGEHSDGIGGNVTGSSIGFSGSLGIYISDQCTWIFPAGKGFDTQIKCRKMSRSAHSRAIEATTQQQISGSSDLAFANKSTKGRLTNDYGSSCFCPITST